MLIVKEKSPSVSKCTKNIVELVQFDSILLCLNFSVISLGSICYVFLRKDYLSRECKANVKCFTCGSGHYVSICESNLMKTRTREQCAKPEQRENVHPEDQPKPDHSQVTMLISSATPILLQTSQAIIYQ